VVERLLGGEQPLAPTTHDLVHRLVAELGGRVAQVTIRRLVGQAVYADVTLTAPGSGARWRRARATPLRSPCWPTRRSGS
jgi:bifunctional DNase/RNase